MTCEHGRREGEACDWCAKEALEGWRKRDSVPWGRFDEFGGDRHEAEDMEHAELERIRTEAGPI